MLGFLRDEASPRKLRLLACALVRAVRPPGCERTIWDLLPGCRWFFSWTLFPSPISPPPI
ncbi:hypothetical protein [Paludisphaera sp.]|uniref:hypothetical protein n=1 Tax=Paludisphaera sp. TaxID=2017432 RepID=UPI00301D2A48